jgi:hypothetical protein
VALHPTQLYMSVTCLWIFFALEWIRRRARFAGQAFGGMLVLYAVTRGLLIEPFRGDFVERNPGYGKHAAVSVRLEKGEGSPALLLERGTAVRDAAGRTGRLLSDVELPAGPASGSAWAISDEPASRTRRGLFDAVPDWDVNRVDGAPAGVEVSAGPARAYHSDLPVPPGYVSTSQWISVFVVMAGIAILVIARRANVPGYTEAVRAHAAAPA